MKNEIALLNSHYILRNINKLVSFFNYFFRLSTKKFFFINKEKL